MIKRHFTLVLFFIFLVSNFTFVFSSETLDPVKSSKELNYGETLGEVSEWFDESDSDFLQDKTFESEDGDLNEDYDQEIYFFNGEFNYKNGSGSNSVREGLFYSSGEVFLSYRLEPDNIFNLTYVEEQEDTVLGSVLEIMGNQYIVADYTIQNDTFDKMTLLGSYNNISLGEGSTVVININGETFTIAPLFTFSKNQTLFNVSGEIHLVSENEILQIGQNQTLFLRDVVTSGREDVLGYVEFFVSEDVIEIEKGEYVKRNNFIFSPTNTQTNYSIYADYNEYGHLILNYSVNQDTYVNRTLPLEDHLFEVFALNMEGTNEPNYEYMLIQGGDDNVRIIGTLENNISFNHYLYYYDLGSSEGNIYLRGRNDEDVLFTSASTGINNTDIMFQSGVIVNSTHVTFNNSQSNIQGSSILLFKDNENQYIYEISSVDTVDLEVDFDEILGNNDQVEIGVDEWATSLEVLLNGATNTTNMVSIPFSDLGNIIAFENEALLEIVEAYDDNLTTNETIIHLKLKLDTSDVDADEIDEEYDEINITLSYNNSDDEIDIKLIQESNLDFQNIGFAKNTIPGRERYFTRYGLRAGLDVDSYDQVDIYVPDDQVDANARFHFNSFTFTDFNVTRNTSYYYNYSDLSSSISKFDKYPILISCGYNCSLLNLTYDFYTTNLSQTLNYTTSFNYTWSKISTNWIRVDFNHSSIESGYKGFNLAYSNNETNSSNYTFDWLEDYDLFVYPINDTIFENETLVLNFTFENEPASPYYLDDIAILFQYNGSKDGTEFTTLNTFPNLTSSGVYDVGFTDDDLNNSGKWKYGGVYSTKDIYLDKGIALNSFNFTIIGIPPILLNDSNLNNSQSNLTKLSLPINLTFDETISEILYSIGAQQFNVSSNLNSTSLNTSIDLISYGNYNITFSFRDLIGTQTNMTLFVNTSLVFVNATINDTDGDNINDSLDKILGTKDNINTNLINLTFEVNESQNISRIFNETFNVTLKSSNQSVVEFNHNFFEKEIDLTKIVLKQQTSNENTSEIFIRGINLSSSQTKTIYLDLVGNTSKFSSLCIKDTEVYDFSDISTNCSGTNETYILSIPYSDSKYSAEYVNSSNSTVKISGLRNSGITQTCTEDWSYSSYGTCSGGTQSRTATDANSCGTSFNLESLTQSCTSSSSSSGGGGGGSSSGGSMYIGSTSSSSSSEDESSEETSRFIKPQSVITSKYTLTVDGLEEVERDYSGVRKVVLKNKDSSSNTIEIDYDFSNSELSLESLNIIEDSLDKSYLIVNGIDIGSNTKTLRLLAKEKSSRICVLDKEISSVNEFTQDCTGETEVELTCGEQNENYGCSVEGDYYVISGLSHSGVVELESKVTQVVSNTDSDQDIQNDQITQTSQKSSSFKFMGYFIIILGILVIVFILFSQQKNHSPKRTSHEEKKEIDKKQELLEQTREYVRKYKKDYSQDEVYRALKKAGVPHDIIDRVFIEEY